MHSIRMHYVNKNKYVFTSIRSKRLNALKQFFIAFDEIFYYAYFFKYIDTVKIMI